MRKKSTKVRISKLFIFLFFSAFLLAIGKLIFVAVSSNVDGLNLTEFANNRNTVEETLYASRGKILDINGEVIAKNANSYTLIAYLSESRTTDPDNPRHVVDKEKTAKALAKVLNAKYEYILGRLNVEGAYQVEFGTWGKDLTENKKVEIEALGLPGLDFIAGNQRYYINSKMAPYIIGYAKTSDTGEIVGEMGIEGLYNDTLKGTDGKSVYQVGGSGYQMGDAYTTEPINGSDIYLTLDSGIQLILEDAINKLEKNYQMSWATISVMDAKTGAIVGSASNPNFNLNTLEGLTSYVDPLVGYTYEPGSTMKIFSWLAAMENGVYDGDETYMSGSVTAGDAIIRDFNVTGWGNISYDTGFAYSSNVGATYLAKKLGNTKLREYYESLGFGKKTNIELPGEESGILRITYESELATASFGQGITTTPIQTLQALSILTNDGIMLKPYIVDKIVNEKGEVTYEGQRTELGRKASSKSIKKMQELMYDVVYNGLVTLWRPDNVVLAGKTGTAQIASPYGGYLSGMYDYIYSFAGFFPYENPKYIIYVSAKQIEGGANSLAPIFADTVESIANYANITTEPTDLDMSNIITLKNYISTSVKDTKNSLEKLELNPIIIGNGNNVINQFPPNKAEVLKNSKVFLLTESKTYTMPDMTGWSTSEVISFCNLIGLKYHFTNYGLVDKFNFKVNSNIDLTKTLEITLKPG